MVFKYSHWEFTDVASLYEIQNYQYSMAKNI
jgi:hypothetical protein